MEETNRELLLQEIEYWRRMRDADCPDVVDIGSSAGPLCAHFWQAGACEDEDGVLCPIHKHTGVRCCSGIGFSDAEQALDNWADDPDSQPTRESWQREADAVVKRLEGLT